MPNGRGGDIDLLILSDELTYERSNRVATFRELRNCFEEVVTTETALITGINGQDGVHSPNFSAGKGLSFTASSVVHRCSTRSGSAICIRTRTSPTAALCFTYGDLGDSSSITRVIQQIQPNGIYNLNAQSQVAVSFEQPECKANFDDLGALRLLDAIRVLRLKNKTRFYQASSSELLWSGTGRPAQGGDVVLLSLSLDAEFEALAEPPAKNGYGQYMLVLLEEKVLG